MRFLSEAGTDEQYVEAVRKWLANPEWSWTRHTCAYLLLWAAAIVIPVRISDGFNSLAEPLVAARHVADPEAGYWLRSLVSTAV
jgi:hypothetical protein